MAATYVYAYGKNGKFAPSRSERLFAELVTEEDKALADYRSRGLPLKGLVAKVRRAFCDRYYIGTDELQDIIDTGIAQQWPPLGGQEQANGQGTEEQGGIGAILPG